VKYAWIREHRDSYPVRTLCCVLAVSTSGYYGALPRNPSPRRQRRAAIAAAAEAAHRASRSIYGYRKVHDALQEQRLTCCRETVRQVLREKGLSSRTKRKFLATTDSDHRLPVAANRLDRDFRAVAPNQKWAADITYIPTREGWLYLAVVMDLFSRRIVGWSLSASLQATLVLGALLMAVVVFAGPLGSALGSPGWLAALSRLAWPWYVPVGTTLTVGIGLGGSLLRGSPERGEERR